MEEFKSTKDFERINDYVKEFLDFNGFASTLECFEAEEKTRRVTTRREETVKVP